MATRAGVAWVEVLPSLAGFGAAVTAGTRVPLASAGRTAGAEYGNGLVGAVRSSLSALGVTVGKQTEAAAAQAAKAVEVAEAKVSQSRIKAADAAGKLRVEELRLEELRSKEGVSGDKIAAAEARVVKARSMAVKSSSDVSVAEARLDSARKGGSAASVAVLAAEEKLALARQRETASTSSVQVAAAKLQAVREKQSSTASQIAAAEENLAKAERAAAAAADATAVASERLGKAQATASAESATATTRFGKFRGAVESGTGAMTSKVKEFSKGALAMGGVFAGFEGVKFAGESLHAAQDFQKGAQVLVTAAGESEKNIEKVKRGLMDISSKTGTSLDQMTEGMYTVEKAGYKGADGLKVMDAAAKGARDEGADLGTVTNVLTTLLTNQGMGAADSAKAMNGLMVAAGASKTSLQEYAGSLSSVLQIAKAASLGFDQVSGAISVMTAKGMSAQNATDTLRGAITLLERPNTAMSNAMAAFGMNAMQVGAQLGKRGLQGTMQYLSDTIKGQLGPSAEKAVNTLATMPPKLQALYAGLSNGTTTFAQMATAIRHSKGASDEQKRAWAEAIPGSQTYLSALARVTGGSMGLQTALMLTSDKTGHFKKTQEEVAKALHNTDDFTKKWGISQKSASTSVAIAKQTLSNMGAAMMAQFLPAISKGALALAHFAQWATELTRTNWGWLKWVGATLLGVVVGIKAYSAAWKVAQLAQVGMKIAAGEATAATAAQSIAARAAAVATKAWAAAQWVFNAAMDGNPIVLVTLAVVALGVAMVVAYKKSATFRNIVQGAFNGIKAAGVWVWDRGLKPAFEGIAKGVETVGKGVMWLWDHAAKPAFSAIKEAGAAIWDHGLKPAFSAIGTALDFVGKHWKVFATILAIPLTPIIAPLVGVFKLLKDHGMDALKTVGSWGIWLWNTALKPAFSAIGALGKWLWDSALKPAIGGIWSGLQTAGRWAMWLWNTAISPAFHAIATLASWLWTNALKPALSGIWGGLQTLAHWVQWVWKNGFEVAFHGIVAVAQWMWKYVVGVVIVAIVANIKMLASVALWLWKNGFKPAFDAIGALASWLWNRAIKPAFALLMAGLKEVGKWGTWLWKNVFSPAFSGIGTAMSLMWNHVVKPTLAFFWNGLKELGKWGTWLWKNAIKPAFDGVGTAVSWAWNRVVKPAFNSLVAGLKDLGKWASWLYDHGIKPAWNSISSTISSVYNKDIKPIFTAFGNVIGHDDNSGLRKVFKQGVNAMGSIWNGLKSAVAKPINAVIDFTNDKFIGGFNSIASKVHVTSIPTIHRIPGYARGGVLPGDSSWRDGDDQVVTMRRGEGVYVSEAMRDPRERARLHAVNSAAMRGQSLDAFHGVPHFDKGGILDGLKHAVSGAAKTVGHAVAHPLETAKSAEQAVTGTLSGDAQKLARVVKFAVSQVHKPYVWGAAGPNAFDCSGLVHAAYAAGAGLSIPHLADSQAHMGRAVSRGSIQPGDMLFPLPGHPVPHVGIAITPDMMVEAANPKVGVIGPHPIPASLPNGARRLLGDVNATEVAGIVKGLGAIQWVEGEAGAAVGALARTMLEPLRGVLTKPIDGLAGMFGKNNFVVNTAGGEAKKIVNGTIDWAEHMADSLGGGSDSSGTPTNISASGGVARWAETIRQALTMNGITPTPDMIARWERQIASESSGNPNAVQGDIGDINNKTGDLAKGLVQVIGSTFRAYHLPGTPNNVFDPLANLAAGINYAKHTYGPSMSFIGNGHGYFAGTDNASAGPAWVAENGPELVIGKQQRSFRGGERVIPAGKTRELLGGDTHIAVHLEVDDLKGLRTVQEFVERVQVEARMKQGV